jgi:hypothetical protein
MKAITDLKKGNQFEAGTPHNVRKAVMDRMRVKHPAKVTIRIDHSIDITLKLQTSQNPNGLWFYHSEITKEQLNRIAGRRVATGASKIHLIISDLGFIYISIPNRIKPININNDRIEIQ